MTVTEVGSGYVIESEEAGKFKTRYVDVPQKPVYFLIKRVFDIIAGSLALIVLFIPLIIVGILIRLDSPGNAIFKQERLGKNGKAFTIYKFRTMRENAEENGAQWAEEDDDRCTRLGKYLRKVRLDEWPQLINIIKGEMSIIGPRPERECFYNDFEQYIDGFNQRLKVKPGLTGWAQVCGGYELLPEEKIAYDLEYIEKLNIWLDIKIILKTVGIIFSSEGAR